MALDHAVTSMALSLTGSASQPFATVPNIGVYKRAIVTIYTGSMTFCFDSTKTPALGSVGHTWPAATTPYEIVIEGGNLADIKAVGPATGYVEFVG